MREGQSGSDPFFSAGIEMKYLISRSFSLGIESSYINYISTNTMEPLYQGMSISIGLTYNMGASSSDSDFRFIPKFDTIFPVFYKYYDKNPVGSVILQNMERGKIDNVKISLYRTIKRCSGIGLSSVSKPVSLIPCRRLRRSLNFIYSSSRIRRYQDIFYHNSRAYLHGFLSEHQ